MEILGYALASLIGISLGLIGGGGSILTVPVLVYLFGFEPVTATAYSLFVVGSSSLIGSISKVREKLVSFKTAILFALPAFVSVFLTRRYLLPNIPAVIASWDDFVLTKSVTLMIVFAVVMLLASISMIRGRKPIKKSDLQKSEGTKLSMILLLGFGVGLLTGAVGAGGGFLIIPTLVILARLPMKVAVGTSLLIISANSLLGFLGDLQTGRAIDWVFLLTFTGIAVFGILVGNQLSKKIAGEKLKKGFGWFVLLMAIYILSKELLFS